MYCTCLLYPTNKVIFQYPITTTILNFSIKTQESREGEKTLRSCCLPPTIRIVLWHSSRARFQAFVAFPQLIPCMETMLSATGTWPSTSANSVATGQRARNHANRRGIKFVGPRAACAIRANAHYLSACGETHVFGQTQVRLHCATQAFFLPLRPFGTTCSVSCWFSVL